ncbi:MAG: inosine/xanthosine triphosphatase [Anaerolineae bacterium]|nr:inosine/xanthosine triphosphatase [Anaerolineae bacterium]
MPLIVVASQNPVKIQAALDGFQRSFSESTFAARGVSVPSGIADQPMSDAETLQGALNRTQAAREAAPDADTWVGIEGGCEDLYGHLWAFAWVVVIDRAGLMGRARTAAFMLPDEVAALVRQGVELGEADDRVFGRVNSKQGNGAVGLLTGDVIDRAGYYEHAVVLALIPFRNPALRFG